MQKRNKINSIQNKGGNIISMKEFYYFPIFVFR